MTHDSHHENQCSHPEERTLFVSDPIFAHLDMPRDFGLESPHLELHRSRAPATPLRAGRASTTPELCTGGWWLRCRSRRRTKRSSWPFGTNSRQVARYSRTLMRTTVMIQNCLECIFFSTISSPLSTMFMIRSLDAFAFDGTVSGTIGADRRCWGCQKQQI